MCGLVAIMGKPSPKMLSVFELMLSIDVVRGKDSTGVTAIIDDHPVTIKDVCFPLKLIRSKSYQKAIVENTDKTSCYIGHNRWATVGNINLRNAHPFTVDHITLVHNGTLRNNVIPEDGTKFESDSKSLAYCIAKHGINWTYERMDGPASLIWWNALERKMSILTNGETPVFLAQHRGISIYWWRQKVG